MHTVSMLPYHYTIGILSFRKNNNLFHPLFLCLYCANMSSPPIILQLPLIRVAYTILPQSSVIPVNRIRWWNWKRLSISRYCCS